METRDVSTKISLSEVPFVMRAMGFYPSEQEVNKSRLLLSSAEMFKKPLWQTVWTQIRLLL